MRIRYGYEDGPAEVVSPQGQQGRKLQATGRQTNSIEIEGTSGPRLKALTRGTRAKTSNAAEPQRVETVVYKFGRRKTRNPRD